MRFLANENTPGAAVEALRAAGNDVVWIRTEAPGSSDPEVLARVARDERILLTFDKDFGQLANASRLPPKCGVILLRVPIARADAVGLHLCSLIMARDDWGGCFSVIEPGRVRMRPLGA